MKKYLIIVTLIFVVAYLYPQDKINVGGGKVAKANNTVITEDELETKYNFYIKNIPQGTQKPTKKDVLKELINKELISQELKNQKNLVLNDEEYKNTLKQAQYMFFRQMKSQDPKYNFNEEDFKKFVEQEFKITYEKYLASIKEQLLFKQFMAKRIEQKVKVIQQKKYDKASDFPVVGASDAGKETFNSSKEFYERMKTSKEFVIHKQIEAKHIFIKAVNPTQDGGFTPMSKEQKDAQRRKIDDINSRLKQGESFDKLCELYSDDEDSKNQTPIRGYLGPILLSGDYAPQFEKMYGKTVYNRLGTLEKGKYSEILESPLGYHIFYIISKKEGGIPSYEEALPKIVEYFRMFEIEKLYQDDMTVLVADLRKKASITYYKNEYKD